MPVRPIYGQSAYAPVTMSLYSSLKTTLSERSQGFIPAIGPTRYPLILLHSLVTIVLVTVGLLATIVTLVLVPIRGLGARWLVRVLVITDTGLTIAHIYLSGNASSNVYVTCFVIMLIARHLVSDASEPHVLRIDCSGANDRTPCRVLTVY